MDAAAFPASNALVLIALLTMSSSCDNDDREISARRNVSVTEEIGDGGTGYLQPLPLLILLLVLVLVQVLVLILVSVLVLVLMLILVLIQVQVRKSLCEPMRTL